MIDALSIVYLASVSNSNDRYHVLGIINLEQDPVIANTDSK